MQEINCEKCAYTDRDNGNCTVVGELCASVPAMHCPMLQEYFDTGLTPKEIEKAKMEIEAGCVKAVAWTYGIDINRLRKLAEADNDGRVVILPCKVGDTVWILQQRSDGSDCVRVAEFWWSDIPQVGKTVFLSSEEAEKALEEKGKETIMG